MVKTYSLKSGSTPTITQVIIGDRVVGTLLKVKLGYRIAGAENPTPFPKIDDAAAALVKSLKVEETKKAEVKKATSEGTPEVKVEKEDPKAVFSAKVTEWLTENHPEMVEEWSPVFNRVLFSLRTRKENLKDIKDIEVAQAMLDFEQATGKRNRMVLHLGKKVNGLSIRGANKKLTPAEQVAAMLENYGVTTETAPKGEKPRELTLRLFLSGVLTTVLLTVREIEQAEPEGEDDTDDSDDSEGGSEEAAPEVNAESSAPEVTETAPVAELTEASAQENTTEAEAAAPAVESAQAEETAAPAAGTETVSRRGGRRNHS